MNNLVTFKKSDVKNVSMFVKNICDRIKFDKKGRLVYRGIYSNNWVKIDSLSDAYCYENGCFYEKPRLIVDLKDGGRFSEKYNTNEECVKAYEKIKKELKSDMLEWIEL